MIRRGDVVVADLSPVVGHGQGGRRPVMVLSPRTYNSWPIQMVIVAPITSVDRQLRHHIPIGTEAGPRGPSFVMPGYVRARQRRRRLSHTAAEHGGSTSGRVDGSIAVVKLSVSLPEEDITYVDEYARRVQAPSRSSVLHRAIGLLRMSELEDAYAMAWDEWETGEDARLWDQTAADGIDDAAR